MSEEQHKLLVAIDDLLWNEWDPVELNEILPRDEYKSYIPQIFNLAISNATAEEIAQELNCIETKSIGLEGNLEKCRQVASMILTKKEELMNK